MLDDDPPDERKIDPLKSKADSLALAELDRDGRLAQRPTMTPLHMDADAEPAGQHGRTEGIRRHELGEWLETQAELGCRKPGSARPVADHDERGWPTAEERAKLPKSTLKC